MTNSEKFHKAHTIAKQIRSCFSCYRDAFGFALSEVYAGERRSMSSDREIIFAEAKAVRAVYDAEDKKYCGNRISDAYKAALESAKAAFEATDRRRAEIRSMTKKERIEPSRAFRAIEEEAYKTAFPGDPLWLKDAWVRSEVETYCI